MVSQDSRRYSGAHWRKAARFWPGPLTLVLRGGEGRLPDELRGREGGIAVRHTSHRGVAQLVKASGRLLSEVEAGSGYVVVDNRIALSVLDDHRLASARDKKGRDEFARGALAGAVTGGEGRPSIETLLHSLMDRYTLHSHPISVALAVCRGGWEKVVAAAYGDAAMVGYRTPGVELAIALKAEIERFVRERGARPRLVFLQSHGIIASSDSVEDVISMTEEVALRFEGMMGVDYSRYRLATKVSSLVNAMDGGSRVAWPTSDATLLEALKSSRDLLLLPPSCPDKQVYCGTGVVELADTGDPAPLQSYAERFHEPPRVVIHKDEMFLIAGNVRKAKDRIEAAAGLGAEVVCLPEMYRTPYFCQTEDHANFALAETVPGPSTEALSRVAKEEKVAVVVPVFERRAPGVYHNSAAVIDADGRLAGLYRKMHIPDDPLFYEKFYFAPGDLGFRAFDVRGARIGILVCWDQWFPEAARLTALAGAQILFYPTAIGWLPAEKAEHGAQQQAAWEAIQRSHAIANGVYVCAVNRVGHEGPAGGGIEFWGGSFVADPGGRIVAKAGQGEEVLVPRRVVPSQNSTRTTPVSSAAVALSTTAPVRMAPGAGEVRLVVGGVRSFAIVTCTGAETAEFPAASRAVAVRVRQDGSQSWQYIFDADAPAGSRKSVPVEIGSDQMILLLFGTGIRGRSELAGVQVKVGSVSAEVLYAGPQSSFAGLDQVNVRIPSSISRGELDIALTVDSEAANIVTVNLK